MLFDPGEAIQVSNVSAPNVSVPAHCVSPFYILRWMQVLYGQCSSSSIHHYLISTETISVIMGINGGIAAAALTKWGMTPRIPMPPVRVFSLELLSALSPGALIYAAFRKEPYLPNDLISLCKAFEHIASFLLIPIPNVKDQEIRGTCLLLLLSFT